MKKSVMVVDDDRSVRESLKKVLEDAGCEVSLAADAAEAENAFKTTDFALLLLDLNLPGKDGWDVLGNVNANYPMVAVVMITGMYDQLNTTIIPGIRALLRKPIEVPLLLSIIEPILAESPEERLSGIRSAFEHMQKAPGSHGYLDRLPEDPARFSRWSRSLGVQS